MDKEDHSNVVMLDRERELKVELALRQIEEGLAHSSDIMARIDKVRRNRSSRLAQEAESAA